MPSMPRKASSTYRTKPPRRSSRQNTARPDPPADNHERLQEIQHRRDIRSTHARPESRRRGRHDGARRSSSSPEYHSYSYSDDEEPASNGQGTADAQYLSELSDDDENEEDVPLFSSPNNFCSVTEGADYRAAKRVQRFDIDDVDFENYHGVDKCYKLGRNASLFVLSFSLLMCIIERDKVASYLGLTSYQRKESQEHQGHRIRAPSSRWGARFDDDYALQLDDGHEHAKKELSKEDKELELEKWEEFESDQAHVLSSSASGWDVYRKPEKSDEAGKGNHWVRYLDPTTNRHYYYLRETNSTQWEKPDLEDDDVLLGIIDGKEYVIEHGHAHGHADIVADDNADVVAADEEAVTENQIDKSRAPSVRPSNETFDVHGLTSHYKETLLRWNHPYRLPAQDDAEAWTGVDTPVFWRIPFSGSTTAEEIFTHCFHLILAGTTGNSEDGKAVKSHNVSDHLSILTLEDGGHYLNFDMTTESGIEQARHAGLGVSGVADIIMTRFVYNAAELFTNTGHTGRCLTMIRHPIHRASALWHHKKRIGAKEVEGKTIEQYASSEKTESNWMTRVLTNALSGPIGDEHYNAAQRLQNLFTELSRLVSSQSGSFCISPTAPPSRSLQAPCNAK